MDAGTAQIPDVMPFPADNSYMEIHEALKTALQTIADLNGTDLVLTIGSPPMIRSDGAIWPVAASARRSTTSLMNEYLADLLDADAAGRSRTRPRRRLRVLVPARPLPRQRLLPARAAGGGAAADPEPHPDVRRDRAPAGRAGAHRRCKQGLILFCGPTGSGKSTSMATLVDAINASRPCHIITIEDPIEYLHENQKAVVHQREVGIDAHVVRARAARGTPRRPRRRARG